MLKGSCHCGKVQWTYDVPLESVTACNCGLCSRYGAMWAYGQLDQGITVSGPTKAYMRGRKINGYHFCTDCGCIAYYLANNKDEKGQLRIAVYLRMMGDLTPIAHLPVDHFKGKDSFEDLPRDGKTVKDLWF
jgi:hypothetical protein